MNHGKNVCHPAHLVEQQQQAAGAAATAIWQHSKGQQQQKYMADIHKCILVRHAASHSIITINI